MKTDNFDKIIRGKNINFLIGSGASVPMYPSLSFGKGYPTFEEVASDINLSDDSKKFLYIYYYLRWIKKWENLVISSKVEFLNPINMPVCFITIRD